MKIIIAPDSFKGSLTSMEAGTIIKNAFQKVFPQAAIEVVPMADGGEGTLDTLLFSTKGKRLQKEVKGPLGEPVPVEYGILGDEETVLIEMAKISGLPMVEESKRNPLNTTTYGIGEVILDAINQGYRKFLIGLGGSATNDGGLGMLQALGATFQDEAGKKVPPFGSAVGEVASVDFSTIHPQVKECQFDIASDVENPLCGEIGASAVFGPQKGADEKMVEMLDASLSKYGALIEQHLGKTFQNMKGAGAAGGLGFAFLSIGGTILSGSKLIAEAANLHQDIPHADLIITGEGQSDFQTLYGKIPGYIGQLASENNIPAMLISGSLGDGYEKLYEYFTSCDSIATGPMSIEDCILHAENLLYKKAYNLAKIIHLHSKGD
ncbi:glycerate kinase [Sutcliffiella rhizosphaerae]|nr:glycerate kinase [Sutcliffiella rhizosphaerae]